METNTKLLNSCKLALEVIRRHDLGLTGCSSHCQGADEPPSPLDSYTGRDNITDPDGVQGIGDVLRAAISEATDGGSTTVTAFPQKENAGAAPVPQTSPFQVCAYLPDGNTHPVLVLNYGHSATAPGYHISPVYLRGQLGYNSLREAAGGDQNIKWLYGQQPQPLD